MNDNKQQPDKTDGELEDVSLVTEKKHDPKGSRLSRLKGTPKSLSMVTLRC